MPPISEDLSVRIMSMFDLPRFRIHLCLFCQNRTDFWFWFGLQTKWNYSRLQSRYIKFLVCLHCSCCEMVLAEWIVIGYFLFCLNSSMNLIRNWNEIRKSIFEKHIPNKIIGVFVHFSTRARTVYSPLSNKTVSTSSSDSCFNFNTPLQRSFILIRNLHFVFLSLNLV